MSRDDDRIVWSSEHGDRRGKRERPRSGGARPSDPADGVVRVRREKKGRGGTTVTTLSGVGGSDADRRELLRELKQRCGCGGTARDDLLELQGDRVDAVLEALAERGLRARRAGG